MVYFPGNSMKKIKILILYCIAMCSFPGISFTLHAQENFPFIENKGQWEKNILFKAHLPVGCLYLEEGQFTFDLYPKEDRHHRHQPAEHANESMRHVYKMNFLNSNPGSRVVGGQKSSEYNNYIMGNNPEKWVSGAGKYASISYHNFYNKTELKIFRGEKYLEYEFLVAPGGNPDDIKIQYSGQDKLELHDGSLIVKNTVCDVTEQKPVAFQEVDGKKILVPCDFRIDNDIVKFIFPEGYDKNYLLVIDPVLIFSTYSGSTADNWGFTATYDNLGNVYSGGIVWGTGYPVTTGVVQAFAGANWDVGIIKYTPDGANRIWATYLGGSSSEMPHSMVVDEFNNLLVFGTTGSYNFPMAQGAFDNTFNGGDSITFDYSVTYGNGADIFISKISENGTNLLGSTFVGGTENDGFNFKRYMNSDVPSMMQGNDSLYYNYGDGSRGEIIVDSKNNVYVGTCTFSNNFPMTGGGFQQANHGLEEGVVFKMTSTLSQMIWSTYLGGTKDDAIYSLDLDTRDNVYVCGGTVSSDFPVTVGSYSTSFHGGTTDGFIAKISLTGSSLLSSSFFGSSAYDQAYFVKLDRYNNAFIAGQTEATGATLVYNAPYNVPNSGQFIAKFDPMLQNVLWSTVFGTGIGKPNISITAFTVDVCSRIYLSGWGREWAGYSSGMDWNTIQGTKNMPVTSDAYQTTTDGQDFYVMVLSDDASQLEYATYFGELNSDCYYGGYDHVDGGTSRFDKKGNIYQSVCGSCGGCDNFPTFPGTVWSHTNNATNCNNAVFRFSFMGDFSIADFLLPPSGCLPYTVNFTNTGIGTNFLWDFGDNTTSTVQDPSHTYTQPGTYDIMLIASDPSSCNIADTIIKQIQVLSNHVDTLAAVDVCIGDSVQIGEAPSSDPNVTYHWFPQPGLSNPNIANPWAYAGSDTEYLLVISNGNCYDSMYQTVRVLMGNYSIEAHNDTLVCSGGSAVLTASTSFPTQSYQWSTSTGFTDTLNPDILSATVTVSPANTTTYYIKGTGYGCDGYNIDSVTVQVSRVATMTSPDTVMCKGDTVSLYVLDLAPGNTMVYSWSPVSSILSGANTATPLISPLGTVSYIVNSVNQFGCAKSDTVNVVVDEVTLTPAFSNVRCYGECSGSASVTATGAPPFIYNWDIGGQAGFIDSVCTGTYHVTVTDTYGCLKTADFVISQPAQLVSSLQVIPILVCGTCSGQMTATVSGGTAPYSYFWSDGQHSSTISNLCYGNYSTTVSDANGCDTVMSGIVTDPSDLQANIAGVSPITCHSWCDGTLTVALSGGNSPYSYLWSNGQNTQSVDSLCSGNYTVTVKDADNCTRVKTFNLSQPPGLNPVVTALATLRCHGDTTTVYAVPYNGTPPFSYQWDDPLHHTSQSVHGVSAGTYTVTVEDSKHCRDSVQKTISEPAPLIVDTLTGPAICRVSEYGSGTIVVHPDGETAPYLITWSDNPSIHDTLRTGLFPGDYAVTVTDARGCDSKVFLFHIGSLGQAPLIDATADETVIYRGQSTVLHATGPSGSFYIWHPSSSLSSASLQNPEAKPDATTLYLVATTDENDCYNEDTITIFVEDVFCREPFVYIPNAFTPNNDGLNDKLLVQTNVASEMYIAIYDRWGELVFETANINNGWDGTYKGKYLDAAVFIYYLKVTCINGEVFEKKGNVTLLR